MRDGRVTGCKVHVDLGRHRDDFRCVGRSHGRCGLRLAVSLPRLAHLGARAGCSRLSDAVRAQPVPAAAANAGHLSDAAGSAEPTAPARPCADVRGDRYSSPIDMAALGAP